MFRSKHKKDKRKDGNVRSAIVSHLRTFKYWLHYESPEWLWFITVGPNSIYTNIKWYRKHPELIKYEMLSRIYNIFKSEKLKEKIMKIIDEEYPEIKEKKEQEIKYIRDQTENK